MARVQKCCRFARSHLRPRWRLCCGTTFKRAGSQTQAVFYSHHRSNDGKPRTRKNVVGNDFKPVLRKLGIPSDNTGLHAFRRGLATQLVEKPVPVTVQQNQLRHADVRTSLKIYAHLIPQSQRDAMEKTGGRQSLRSSVTLLKFASKCCC